MAMAQVRPDEPRLLRRFRVPDRWLVHAYYTVSPYAPDGTDRVLVAGADLDRNLCEVLILGPDGDVLDRFGTNPIRTSFFHTGRWQTWSADGSAVYFDSGTVTEPRFVRRDVATGHETVVPGSLDGGTPSDGPLISGLLAMHDAASDAVAGYRPDASPVPFQAREEHGLFEYALDPPSAILRLSVAEILARHPDRDLLHAADAAVRRRLGDDAEGLTLLTFCVRWSPDGSRLLFFFGNNGVPDDRTEPRVKYVMTARADLTDLHVAMDLGSAPGVHWSWQPDNVTLIGYGPDPENPDRLCLAEVRFDGTGYRKLAEHTSGGHPSVSPVDPDLLVTDHYPPHGRVSFLTRDGQLVGSRALRLHDGQSLRGRSPHRIDAHPVFHPSGDRVLCNSLPGRHAELIELEVPR
ncbi:hypothetical protein [Occultella kanbiaonis]|uniref:hypothetical protein n=1 Tax=Occultella kanbiaonis TaxID=2675754 RepID=UPI001B356BA2|nr:hypothetical protein [Occultella kanbiaonis]